MCSSVKGGSGSSFTLKKYLHLPNPEPPKQNRCMLNFYLWCSERFQGCNEIPFGVVLPDKILDSSLCVCTFSLLTRQFSTFSSPPQPPP